MIKQIGLPLRGRTTLLITRMKILQTELDSTQSYYHHLSGKQQVDLDFSLIIYVSKIVHSVCMWFDRSLDDLIAVSIKNVFSAGIELIQFINRLCLCYCSTRL